MTAAPDRPRALELIVIALFAATIGLAAFLGFVVQPLATRLLLPELGGGINVWATAQTFFQVCLLCGYAAAVVLGARLGPRRGLLVAAAIVALVAAPLTVAGGVRMHASGSLSPELTTLAALAVAVGSPTLVLFGLSPLLQLWWSHRYPHRAYVLYVPSNVGSLTALLAYPFVIEPNVGLATQGAMWVAGIAVVAVLLVVVRITWARVPVGAHASGVAEPPRIPVRKVFLARGPGAFASAAFEGPAPGWSAATPERIEARRFGAWIVVAAIPVGLSLALTNRLTLDVSPTPLVWTLPLSAYLVALIVAFSDRGVRVIRAAQRSAGPAIVGLIAAATLVPYVPYWISLVTGVGLYLIVATALAGWLVALRPSPAHLTRFYLASAVGGALAGASVSLVAPIVLARTWELELYAIAAALVALAGAVGAAGLPALTGDRRRNAREAAPVAIGVIALAGVLALGLGQVGALALLLPVAIGLAAFLVRPRLTSLAAVVVAVVVLGATTSLADPAIRFTGRSFYGIVSVREAASVVTIVNGSTTHGYQRRDPSGALVRELSGYYPIIGDVLARARAAALPTGRIAVIGLGSGTLAVLADDDPATGAAAGPGIGADVTFYEIDPLVDRIAERTGLFSFVPGAPPGRVHVVIGDGRTRIAEEPDRRFDVVVGDAFSSDAVPTHLLTLEALREYARVLTPDGFVLFHISNRFVDLEPVVGAAARTLGWGSRTIVVRQDPPRPWLSDAQWVILTPDPSIVARLPVPGARPLHDDGRPAWTDDRTDLLHALRLGG